MKELYAHSANSQGKKHRLDSHLKEVAELAKNSPINMALETWLTGWVCGMIWEKLILNSKIT